MEIVILQVADLSTGLGDPSGVQTVGLDVPLSQAQNELRFC